VLKVDSFAGTVAQQLGVPKGSRHVALHLEQRPYVQVFTLAVPEEPGSVPLPTGGDGKFLKTTELRNGRVMRMHSLVARQQQQSDLDGDTD
jgi:hypothetical protein